MFKLSEIGLILFCILFAAEVFKPTAGLPFAMGVVTLFIAITMVLKR